MLPSRTGGRARVSGRLRAGIPLPLDRTSHRESIHCALVRLGRFDAQVCDLGGARPSSHLRDDRLDPARGAARRASTEPSRRLRTHPETPNRSAERRTKSR